jgi:hypothetical protein
METMDKTVRELYREYYQDMRNIAFEIVETHKLESENQYHECDDARDTINQSVESTTWGTYTYQARLVGILSENVSAFDDECGEHETCTPEIVAYYAMIADVEQLLTNEWFWKEVNEKLPKGTQGELF